MIRRAGRTHRHDPPGRGRGATRRLVAADPLAFAASALLFGGFCWKLALAALSTSPAGAADLLRSAAPGEAGDARSVRTIAIRAQAAEDGSQRADARHRRLAALVRSYGYDLPVLVTLDEEGHVVRVQRQSPANE